MISITAAMDGWVTLTPVDKDAEVQGELRLQLTRSKKAAGIEFLNVTVVEAR